MESRPFMNAVERAFGFQAFSRLAAGLRSFFMT